MRHGLLWGTLLLIAVGLMIEEVNLARENNPKTVPEKFRKLGEKVNLLTMRGELVLSGIEFSESE